MDISYIINELGEEREQYFDAVAPPIMQTSNFGFRKVDQMRKRLKNEAEQAFYSRGVNPTVDILCKKLAALEGAEDALVFASGSAAIAAAIMANINAREHIICVAKPYKWTEKLLNSILVRFGVETTMIDGTDPENFRKAIRPNTRLIMLESPNSFTFEMQDIEAVTKLAKAHKITTIIDNSYASPLYQNAIAMGVDISLHSATKYISGHSDTIAGVVCGTKEMISKIFHPEFMTIGGIAAPFTAWLLLRGLRTLPVRMEQISNSVAKVVNRIRDHPKVEGVYYPFLETNPQYELARKQLKKPAGQFTIRIKASTVAEVELFCNSLTRFLMAASWGGHESLIFPACATLPADAKNESFNLIRFYIGLEDSEVLIADIKQAFEKIQS